MIRLLEFPLVLPDGHMIHSSMGSLMQGVLMEQIPGDKAEQLHQQGLRPYSQCVYFDKQAQQARWRFGYLTNEAYDVLYPPIANTDSVYIQHDEYSIGLKVPVKILDSSCKALADQIFQAEKAPSGCEMQFLTPASFKQQGHYINIPDLRLLFQSLLQRWNTFTDFASLAEEHLPEKLAEACQLTRYNLYSQAFSLEGRRIYGFGGRMCLRFHGNDMVRRILGLLCLYAPYSGIGIKTAIGMGAVNTKLILEGMGKISVTHG